MGKLLIKNGRVMDPARNFDGIADVLMVDGRIAAIGRELYQTVAPSSSTHRA